MTSPDPRVAKGLGFTDADIERVTTDLHASGLDASGAALLRAVDRLRTPSFVDDRVRDAVESRDDDAQLMDVVVTTGRTVASAGT